MPEPRRPQAPNRAVRALVRGLVLVTGLVGVGLVGAAAAWAGWSAQASASGTELRSGTLDMQVSGLDNNLAGPGGSATLPTLTLAAAEPGASTSASFTINNAGTATFVPDVVGTADEPLTSWLHTTTWYGGTTCTNGTTSAPTLAAGASTSVCVVVTLDSGAPASVQGTSANVTLALTATQVR
ncbi:MAG: hypothetical protein FWF02_02215 [Micrococcales bacterium]|nr:hypothetical protein [Micrococcales bacterium]MCL2666506.1 hypothetical protein [Micrococcales bacterium]